MTEQLTTATAYNILLMLLKYRTDVKNHYHTLKRTLGTIHLDFNKGLHVTFPHLKSLLGI